MASEFLRKWSKFTGYTAFSGLFPLLSKVASVPLEKLVEISQTIDSENFTVQNSVLFSGPLATTSISTNAKFEVRSPKACRSRGESVSALDSPSGIVLMEEAVFFKACKSRITRRCSTDSYSPEFEFWKTGNSDFPDHHDLHSADQLFSGGFLLPLCLLHLDQPLPLRPPAPPHRPEHHGLGDDSSASSGLASSKRWTGIFKRTEKNHDEMKPSKEKKRDRRSGGGGGGAVNAAELNINIWPFSRSRSAGNGATAFPRSYSGGEANSRARAQLGQSRPGPKHRHRAAGEKGAKREPNEAPQKSKPAVSASPGTHNAGIYIEQHQHQLTCSSNDHMDISVSVGCSGSSAVSSEGIRGFGLLRITSFFAKRVL